MKRIMFLLLTVLFAALILVERPQRVHGRVSTALAAPADPTAPTGNGPTVNVPVVHISDAPVMDGKCEPEEYGEANSVSYQYRFFSDPHVVYILRTPHHLYFCFWLSGPVGMPEAGTDEDAYVAVYLDRLNDGQLGGDDMVVRQPFLSSPEAATWDAAQNSFSGEDPGGWQVANYSHQGTPGQEFSRHWTSAEFRISRQTVGGWQRTIGFAVMYHHIPCPLTCLIENYGWPHDGVFANPQEWGNANLPTGEITIGPTDVIPTVDGRCDFSQEWADAAFVQFPSGTGLASARAMHSDTGLYACLVLFQPAAAVADGPNAAVMINRTGEGGERPGPDDMRFTISFNGTVRANRGDGSGWDGPDPGGYTIARQKVNLPNTNLWHAEFRISAATLGGGWDRDIDIGFAQQWLNAVGDDYGWPQNSWWWNIPNTWGVGHLTSNPVPEAQDIWPTGMEVVQTVQDLDNSVLLVANKRTFVRVHVDTDSSVNGVTARLHGFRDGVPLGFPLIPVNPGGDILILHGFGNRGALNDSFLFELPSTWTKAGTIALRAEVNPFHDIEERSYHNNDFYRPINTFVQTSPLRLRLVNYQYVRPNGAVISVRRFDMDMVESQLRRMFPISQLIADRRVVADLTIDSVPSADYVNSHLRYLRHTWDVQGDGATDAIYYGMVSDTGGRMRGEAEGIPALIASGPAGTPDGFDDPAKADTWDFDGTYADWYAAHELGHALGRYHAEFCGAEDGRDYPYPKGTIGGPAGDRERFYGFDAGDSALNLKTKVIPNTWTDVMTYCASEWISDFTYEGIHDYIQDHFEATASGVRTVSAAADGDFLSVYGSLNVVEQTAAILFVSRQATVARIPERIPGAYHIQLFDPADNLLADYPFSPIGEAGAGHEEVNQVQQIAQIVDWVEGTQRIAIYSDVAGRELASTTVSANPPAVAITGRSGGDALPASGPVTLAWDGTDTDGDALDYILLYSFDDRASWRTLATTHISNTLTIDAGQLEGTGEAAAGWLRVVANDGVLTAQADTGPFQVEDKAPSVQIASPAPDSVYTHGQTVALEGYGRDFEEGTLADAQLTWHSSLDGKLGTGHLLHPVLLSVGDHVVTLVAVDAAGNEASASVTISVVSSVEDAGPTLTAAPISLAFQATAGAANPAPLRLSVRNTGSGVLDWTASADASWLTLSTTTGTAPGEIMVSVDSGAFQPGEVHDATITLVGGGQIITMPVTVQMIGTAEEIHTLYLPAIWNVQSE